MIGHSQSYTYLGHDINLSATSEEGQIETIIDDFKTTMANIDIAPLPVAAMIQAVNIMATSNLHFYFPNIMFSEKTLDTIEDTIVFYVRSWLGLNNSSTRPFFFCPRAKGGLGLISPRIMYHAKKLSFHLSMLNNDDTHTREAARNSLQLHLSKRKCLPSTATDGDNFAGYKTDNNYRLVKTSKVNWRRSPWVHLNEICIRTGVRLRKNDDSYVLVIAPDQEVQFSCKDPSAFFTLFKTMQLNNMHEELKKKDSQGRMARTENVDFTLSVSHLTNVKISDNVLKFVVKARLQLVECNTLLNLYYPGTYSKQCARCHFHTETLSHILNGCNQNKNAIQKRHNRIAEIITNTLSAGNRVVTVHKDKPIKPNDFDRAHLNFATNHTRPDACIINQEDRSCVLVEVSVPFDSFVHSCYSDKFNKYLPLCQEINALGYTCRVYVFVVGSLGTVHTKFVPGLKQLGISAVRAKAIARYCSVSAMIGSKQIWQYRCRHTD